MITLTVLRDAVRARPDDASACFALGRALADRGEYVESLQQFQRAASLEPDNALYHRAAGLLLGNRNDRMDDAIASLERALALAPGEPEVYESLGEHYRLTPGRVADARPLAARAIAAFPHRLPSYVHLARACLDLDQDPALDLDPAGTGGGAAAVAAAAASARLLQRSVAAWLPPQARPDLADVACVRALIDVGGYDAARDLLVGQRWPAIGRARRLGLLAEIESALGDVAAARRAYERARRLAPGDTCLLQRYLSLLWQVGEYDRLRHTLRRPAVARLLGIPDALRHPASMRGRTLLLQNPGGCGDALQWSRAAALWQALGARVLVECLAPVRDLLRTMPGVAGVCAPHDERPPYDEACHADLALQLLPWDWPALEALVPYVQPPDSRVRAWRRQRTDAGDALHVGIEWRTETDRRQRGNPYTCRSMPLEAVAPLTHLPDMACYGMHIGPSGARERQTSTADIRMIDLKPTVGDFIDTAAAIRALDAIVTIDSAIAHTAGACGMPVVLLLSYRPDWRWGTPEAPARWYPGCRIVRQATPGDWHGTLIEASAELRRMLAARRAA